MGGAHINHVHNAHHFHNGRGFYGYGFGYYPGYGYYSDYGYGYGNGYGYPYYADSYYGAPSYPYYPGNGGGYVPNNLFQGAPQPQFETPVATRQCEVQVYLPDPDAQVWFDGNKTMTTGAKRTFWTPDLREEKTYSYTVTAAWNQGGKVVGDERTVQVRAGARVVVDFTQPGK
jgi:uncharacterized protein (TIGR03000 family)